MRIICVFSLYHWVSCIMFCEIIILCVNPPFLVWKKVRKVKSLSHVQLFVTPWTIACQAPPSMGFSRQEHWSGLPFPSPGDLPDPGMDPGSPALQEDPLPSEPPGNPTYQFRSVQFSSVQLLSRVWLFATPCIVFLRWVTRNRKKKNLLLRMENHYLCETVKEFEGYGHL